MSHSRLRLSEVVCSTRSVIRILVWCVLLVNMTEDLKLLSDIQPTSRDGKLIIPAIVSFFQDYQERFLNMFEKLQSEFTELCKSKDVKVEMLEGEIKTLKHQISKLNDKIEESDNYERRDTLVLTGDTLPPEKNMECCADIVVKLIKDNLKVNISPNEISVCHRLASTSPSQKPVKKDIIVKFCRRNTKMDILNTCRKRKPEKFFINEFLTPQRQTISFVLRKARKEFPNIVSGSTSFEGKIFVWVKPPNPDAPGARDSRMAVNTHEKLVEFCTKTLSKPITHFIKEWTH